MIRTWWTSRNIPLFDIFAVFRFTWEMKSGVRRNSVDLENTAEDEKKYLRELMLTEAKKEIERAIP